MKIHSTAIGLILLGSAKLASANAFNISEHDAEVTGRGNAAAASDTGASSVIFAPGGIAISEGVQVAVSGTLVAASGSYTDAAGKTKTDSGPAVLPAVFVTARLTPMVAVGFGFHLPFGLDLSWPDNHEQADVLQDQALRTYFLTPSVGLNLDKQVPGLSIGGGIDLVPATVELSQQLRFGSDTGTAHLGGSAFGIGGRAGVMYRPPALRQLKIGATWASSVKLDFSGKGDFDIAAPYRDQLPPDGDISTSIKLPMSITGGVAYSPIPALELEADVRWMNWTSFKQLAITLPGGSQTVTTEDYQNTTSIRLGAEYKIPNAPAAVRAGFIYDPTPIPTTTLTAQLPDANRKVVTAGGSYRFGDYGVHASLLYVLPSKRTTSDVPFMPVYKAEYEVSALVATLSLTGTFGAPASPQ